MSTKQSFTVGRPALWQQSDLPVIIPIANLPPGKVVPPKIPVLFDHVLRGFVVVFQMAKYIFSVPKLQFIFYLFECGGRILVI